MIEGSPEWWLLRMYRRLIARAPEVLRCERYYDGHHDLAFVTSEYRREFGQMLRGLSDNWMALVVDAVEERMHVDGFRLGTDTAGDSEAWEIWQRNQLDADSEMVHSTALQTGAAFAMVWFGKDERPEITVEHPSQVYVAYENGSQRRRAAALKVWVDEWTGATRANVYLPDGIHKYESAKAPTLDEFTTPTNKARSMQLLMRSWKPIATDPVVPNPLEVVPIVEFRNRPRMLGEGRSEIQDVLSTQDQINKLVCDMLIASEFAAFRQRWATGVEEPIDPKTGKPIVDYQFGPDRFINAPMPDAKFGEFGPTDLGNYVKAIENRVQSLASRTRTPPHYLLGASGNFPSGESLKATETGLVAKVRSRQRHFGESWEEVIRLAFKVADDNRSESFSAETIWVDPESRSEGEHVDALLKLRSLNVPLAVLWEKAKFSTTEIARFKQLLVEEGLNRILAGEPAVVAEPPARSPMTTEL